LKRPALLIVLLALAAGLLAYFGTRLAMPAPDPAPDAAAKLAWLSREFSLTPAQTAEIDRLQQAYGPVCMEHCDKIAAAEAALASAHDEPSRAAARRELARVQILCAEATRAHLEAVAAIMPPDQAARFLALMEPRVAHTHGRTGAPDLAPRP
jgi:hypothetical protein